MINCRYHSSDECPGVKKGLHYKCFSCNSRAHISALCPNDVKEPETNTQTNLSLMPKHEPSFLLRTITDKICRHNKQVEVTGMQ